MNNRERINNKQVPTTPVGVENKNGLVGLRACRDAVFMDDPSKPSFRTFCEWKARRYFPVVKVGRRVFASPDKVRTALEKRFTIEAID
jgi:hypothetical protein